MKLIVDTIREEDIGLPALFSAKAPKGYVDVLDEEDLKEIIRCIEETGIPVKEQLAGQMALFE